jgi:anti-anti-sigma factor
MPLDRTITRDGGAITVALHGDFTFAESASFRTVMDEIVAGNPTAVTVELSGLQTVDSAGLSMFVRMRERLASIGASVTLKNPSPLVDRVFSVVAFRKLFTIVR